jgi:hypothetical protein
LRHHHAALLKPEPHCAWIGTDDLRPKEDLSGNFTAGLLHVVTFLVGWSTFR